ncbi:hypothetical protein [Pontibacter sp. G13]|uniref:hypothetical protein n=1 Tax=Pontibacter sp. G13 TaxID=3074898 RepID=UPI00288B437F|nr:hypothetical protein [Pontibacter sp. G13]WNJ18806.1 hypothetical protein RJD25_28450 [Pontibacter sp. G13]
MRLIIIAIMALIANGYPKGVLSQGFLEQSFDSTKAHHLKNRYGDIRFYRIEIFSYGLSDSDRSPNYQIFVADGNYVNMGFGGFVKVNGNPIVRLIRFWDNGLIEYSVQFHNGRESGIWTFYSENGELIRKEDYTSGEMICDPCLRRRDMDLFEIHSLK